MNIGRHKQRNREKLINEFGNLKNEQFDFTLIEKYFRGKDHSATFQTLSDKVCNDIDFYELFTFIDRTNSKVGQQFLYDKMRTLSLDGTENEKLICELTTNIELRIHIQSLLSKLNSTDSYYISSLFLEEHLKNPKWLWGIKSLSGLSLLFLILAFIKPITLFFLFATFIINMGVHYWNKKHIHQYLNSIPQLLKLNDIAKTLLKSKLFRESKKNPSKSVQVIEKIKNQMRFFRLEVMLQGDSKIILWGIWELFKILFLLEPMFLFDTLKKIKNKKNEIENVFTFIGEIDATMSILSLRSGLKDYCLPNIIHEQKKIVAINVYHPLIVNCKKNSIKVDKKSILLTGSNMSGKTSFIRTIGINALTGMTLNTCFADEFTMPKMGIFSAIRINDNLEDGKSYYFEEVITIKGMLDKCTDENINLLLLDELFKGTNTTERISAGKAVLSYLSKMNSIVFVSTHDIELADLLRKEFELYHFCEKVENGNIQFDYELKKGKLQTRNAIKILIANGFPESIIKEAITVANRDCKMNSVLQY